MHKDNLEKILQFIYRPNANYKQAYLFFKLLQQTTSDISRSMQYQNAIVDIIYRSYYLIILNCGKLWINITFYTCANIISF